MKLVPTIGLEVHAQLRTRSKMFCGCDATYGGAVNSQTCPVCLGLPGTLPIPNRMAIEMAARTGLALNCNIARLTKFDRKNYFYPDLPKGYQISQFDQPLCAGGHVEIRGEFGVKSVGITRIHLEEDAGKSQHSDDDGTLVDFNRCGVPLIEIVSEPDMSSAAEAYAYLMEIRRLVRWLGVCDGNLEEGSLRCDANVSVAAEGARGIAVEIKNLNSFHGVEKALKYEILRQSELIQSGGRIVRQTLLWDADRLETRVMRTKEASDDYRYFPDPDLVELTLADEWMASRRADLPELPQARRQRYVEKLGLKNYDVDVLTADIAIAGYFDELLGVDSHPDPSEAARWVTGEGLRWRKELGDGERFVVGVQATAQLMALVAAGSVSANGAKTVYEKMARDGGGDPANLIDSLGLRQMSNTGELERQIREVIAASPAELERYRNGEQKLLGFFMGQLMKATRGRADPVASKQLMQKFLSG